MSRVAHVQAETQEAFTKAVKGRRFPTEVRARASKVLERLQTATRVTVMGMPGSGKSALVNLLAGEEIIPLGTELCTMKLVYGAQPLARVTLRDGSSLVTEGAPELSRVAAMSPAFVQVELPLAALKKITLLEVVAPKSRLDQVRAMNWAMKQTDIAVWCTAEFDASEQVLWDDAPDAIKDHAILARTHADLLGGARAMAEDDLRRIAGLDFAQIIAISSEEARMARSEPNGVNKALLKESGATRIISTILRQIENGRQSAVDQAQILLHKYRAQIANAPIDEVEPEEEPVVEAEAFPVVPQPVQVEAPADPVVEIP